MDKPHNLDAWIDKWTELIGEPSTRIVAAAMFFTLLVAPNTITKVRFGKAWTPEMKRSYYELKDIADAQPTTDLVQTDNNQNNNIKNDETK